MIFSYQSFKRNLTLDTLKESWGRTPPNAPEGETVFDILKTKNGLPEDRKRSHHLVIWKTPRERKNGLRKTENGLPEDHSWEDENINFNNIVRWNNNTKRIITTCATCTWSSWYRSEVFELAFHLLPEEIWHERKMLAWTWCKFFQDDLFYRDW